ncbi:MAG TPA: S8 family serine peptidase [Solirubrobacterales bacterium]|nr:S8 family serine peptidase [Solirubrobacterales bacterium]
MPLGLRINRSMTGLLLAAVLIAGSVPPGAGAAPPAPKQHGPLSPELRRLGGAALSGQSPAQQAAALGLPAVGPGSLIRAGRRVLVEVRFESGALERLGDLRTAGAQIVAASRSYQTVTAAVPTDALRGLGEISGVGSVTAVPAPLLRDECEGGSVISEGVAQLNAKAARERFGLDGEGVTVGVLSDSYNKANESVEGGPIATKAPQDVATADLPGPTNPCLGQNVPVDVRHDFVPSEPGEEAFDEGRAMLQIVHDMAPAAKLAFASAFSGETAFAESIEELAKPVLFGGAGAKVIVDDVGYLEEPFFQDGPIAAAVNKVTAEGATYLSAAGNDNLLDGAGHDIASWEAPSFRDAGSCPGSVQARGSEFNPSHCMDFAPGTATDTTFGITVEAGETLLLGLQWAEPWFGVGTDMDAFLLNAGGSAIVAEATEDNVSGTKKPVELLSWTNSSSSARTVQLVVNRFSGSNPRLKFVLFENGGGVSETEYPASGGGDVVGPTVYGHAGDANAIGVGAIRYSTLIKPESYSSRGPVTHYFGEVSGTTPAAPLASAQIIPKPDVVATDCGATTFFAIKVGETWRFCGTSAAAPHAAGAVALMLQAGEEAGGGLSAPEPLRSALLQSAVPVGSFGPCAVGAGMVEVEGAGETLLADPGPLTPPACEPPVSPAVEEPSPPAPAQSGSTAVPTPTPQPTPAAPETMILKHPPKLVRTAGSRARVVFRFGSNQHGVTFLCKVDRFKFAACSARFVRRLGLGRHALKVKARSASGLTDPTPAVFRFRIEPR